MSQGLGHINCNGEKILVLVRQGKITWHYKLRKSGREGFEVMDNKFFNTTEGLQYVEKIKQGESITL